MWTVTEEIEKTLAEFKDLARSIRRCNKTEASKIYSSAKEKFVEGDPRVWWLGLRPPFEKIEKNSLEEIIPSLPDNELNKESIVWFIPETDDGGILVFEATLENIITLINETVYFEYNIVSKNFEWLLAENDHNEFLFAENPEIQQN